MSNRNLTFGGLVFAAAVTLSACGVSLRSERLMTLEVTGTRGTAITGEYILTTGDGTTHHALDREVPFSIEVSGHDLSCMLQKLGSEGTVRLRLLVDGELVAFAWTKDLYGNVSVDTP